ncbi:urate hydroxylase PuuD [Falsiroseomonas sp. E2-1-a20]|uniref:urate hydroxylase PuuD n=1 Tax=Falsiroseomonas sp. E2-1-a20 TaxID=3239300 RepID=UPI003F3D280A
MPRRIRTPDTMDLAYLSEWANLLIRWLHLITGIAWIGTSFYFIGLDNQLDPPRDGNPRVKGEQWSIHGGGFYHKQKYLNAPAQLPEKLHWFKWEAYWTWISGFSLFMLIYWGQASTYLVDPAVLDMRPGVAVAVSATMLVAGWVVYDLACKSKWGEDDRLLSAFGVGLLVVVAFVACHVFSGRGAFLQVGAITGTIMVANVAMVIIPGQRKMVAAMQAGQEPDPKYGRWGKQRSVHNTYLTLPVLFLMISPHYPMTWSGPWNWVVLLAITLAGALVRQFFVQRQFGRSPWALPAAATAVVCLLAFALMPARGPAGVVAPAFAEVEGIMAARCASCHAAHPTQEGFVEAPKGVRLDEPGQIRRWAQSIRQQVATEAMPPGNLTEITAEERAALVAWVAAGAPRE